MHSYIYYISTRSFISHQANPQFCFPDIRSMVQRSLSSTELDVLDNTGFVDVDVKSVGK